MLRKTLMILASTVAATCLATPASAQGADPFLGQVMIVPYTFCPNNWLEANGQLLAVNQYSALYSLMGITYGGNGTTNFALPNLQGRAPIHIGSENGSTFVLGQVGGNDNVTQLASQMPMHTHSLNASNTGGTLDNPTGALLADFPAGQPIYAPAPPNTVMAPQAIGIAGGSQPMPVRDPYLAMRYCISMSGIFPSRP